LSTIVATSNVSNWSVTPLSYDATKRPLARGERFLNGGIDDEVGERAICQPQQCASHRCPSSTREVRSNRSVFMNCCRVGAMILRDLETARRTVSVAGAQRDIAWANIGEFVVFV
jgi:hypothetical protein